MAYRALYRTWRPEKFSDVVGQETIVRTLTREVESGHIGHAYLFCGSRGTGKTSTARIFAKAVNCLQPVGAEPCGVCASCEALKNENSLDVVEIDAASNNGVDDVRELRDKIAYPPSVGRYKVYIIDEVHMLSAGAFNALLKTLEEPPSHAVFILATTEPQKLPATILSRCQRFDFKRVGENAIVGLMEKIVRDEKIEAERDALSDIARSAEGGVRDALGLLDMCLAGLDGTRLTDDIVRDVLGTADKRFFFDFADALIQGDAAACLAGIDRAMRDGRDPAVITRGIVAHLRALLLAQLMGGELAAVLQTTEEDAARYREQAQNAARERLTRGMDLFMTAQSDMKWASQPRTALELSAIRACHPERERGEEALRDRISTLEKQMASGVVPSKAAAPKATAPKPEKSAPVKKAAEPAPEPLPEAEAAIWQKAMALVKEKNMSLYSPLTSATFKGIAGDEASIYYQYKWKMYMPIFKNAEKHKLVEDALSEAAGRPLRLRVTLEGEQAAPAAKAPKENLTQIFEAFGRENVLLQDDP